MSERRDDGGFLGRWSRLKTEARTADSEAPAPPAAPAPAVQPEDAPPELPPVESLTIDSDFRGFFHPKVDEDLRRSALRKLFSDPHFNVMDGLDVYIDDYSVSEPIPPEMLAGMKQAQRILRWAAGHDDEEAAEERPESEIDASAQDAPAAIAAPPAETASLASDPAFELAPDPIPETVVAKPD